MEMTNIELSDVELGAVSGGDYSFWPSAPSKETVQKISTVSAAVSVAVAAPAATFTAAAAGTGAVLAVGAYTLLNN
jgi:hypothetical protein